MLIQRESINEVKDFGINSYESKLWMALLSKGVATAGELSDIANVPRSRTYDVLESLEKKGFLIMKIGKPIKYLAVDPEHVLDRVQKKIHEDAEVQSRIMGKLLHSDILKELKLLHTTGIEKVNPADFSGFFKGRRNIVHYVEKAIKTAKKSVIIQTTETGLAFEKELKAALKKAKQNGVKISIAAPINMNNQEIAMDLTKVAEVRSTSELGRFFIIDNNQIVFMLLNDADVHKSYDSAIWVKSPFFVKAFTSMFDASWTLMRKI